MAQTKKQGVGDEVAYTLLRILAACRI